MNRPPARSITALSYLLLAAGLLVLGLAGFLDPARGLVLRPIGELQSWVAARVAAVRDFATMPRDVSGLIQRNAELEAEVARLQQEVIRLQEQVAEVEVLSALLNYARTRPENRYLAANVVGWDVSPFLRSVWIARGSNDGLVRGMPVVTERGLVGRLVEVFPTMSRVQLIIDPEAAVNVRLQTSRAEAVTAAQPNGELWVELISQDVQVAPEELVVTSGLGGGYPPDIPVGQVVSVRRRDYEIFQQAVVQPVVDFDRLYIVLVITNFSAAPQAQPTR